MSETQDFDKLEVDEPNEIDAEDQKAQAEAEAAKPEDDGIEPRYRGKTVQDIIKMHHEAEKLIGRQAQEVGEVRKLADELIKSQLTRKTEVEAPKVDFFENPEEAIKQAIESSPDVKQAREYGIRAQQEMARNETLRKHPDALEMFQNEEFRSWVMASNIRKQLALQADQKYDVDAADELLSTYKALHKPVVEVDPVEKAARQATMKRASVDTGGSGESSKKFYSRRKLIELQIKSPSKFAAMQPEIIAAYSEGRVKD